MSNQDTLSDKKDPSSMTAYERWELPTLEEGQPIAASMRASRSIKPLTATDLERIRADAYQDGLKQGIEEGHKQGLEQGIAEGSELGREQGLQEGRKQAAQELVDHKASLERLCVSLLDPIEEQRQNVEQVLLNTTLALVRAVIHTETKQNPKLIESALNSALESLPKSATGISIQLHPEDLKLVSAIETVVASGARLSPNPKVVRGGCIVETSQQVIDYTIEARFQQAVQKMLLDAAQVENYEAHPETPNKLASHSDYHKDVLDQGLQAADQSVDLAQSDEDQKPESSEEDDV